MNQGRWYLRGTKRICLFVQVSRKKKMPHSLAHIESNKPGPGLKFLKASSALIRHSIEWPLSTMSSCRQNARREFYRSRFTLPRNIWNTTSKYLFVVKFLSHSYTNLFLNQVNRRNHFCHRMLNLNLENMEIVFRTILEFYFYDFVSESISQSSFLLYLDPSIHFHKVKGTSFIQKELNRSNTNITYGCCCCNCCITHGFPQLWGQCRRRCFFQELLVPSL